MPMLKEPGIFLLEIDDMVIGQIKTHPMLKVRFKVLEFDDGENMVEYPVENTFIDHNFFVNPTAKEVGKKSPAEVTKMQFERTFPDAGPLKRETFSNFKGQQCKAEVVQDKDYFNIKAIWDKNKSSVLSIEKPLDENISAELSKIWDELLF